jgi:hypothetical protein
MTDRSGAATLPGAGGLSALRMTPRALVLWTIVISAVVRLVMDQAVGFGNGEGYYLASARHLALSYFDQPPLFLWLAHFTIDVTGTGSSLLPRLPFVAIFAGTTWLMYRLGAKLFGEAAGAWSAVLLNLSVLFTVSVGAWVQPDATLFFFLTAAALPLVDLCFGQTQQPWRKWVLAGLWFGLAMLSKYHAALILAGLVIFVVTTPRYRAWFLKPGVLLAGLIASLCFLPVLLWNLENHWASFAFQGERIARTRGLRFDWLARSILGQALIIGPLIWPPLMVVFYKGLKAGPREAKTWFLCCLAIVPIILFTAAALWAPLGYHFHWQGPGYLYLFPLLGKAVSERMERGDKGVRNYLIASAALLIFVVGLLASQAETGWMHGLMARFTPNKPYYAANVTRETLDWGPLRAGLRQRGLLDAPRTFMVTGKWYESGHADSAVGDKLPVVCLCDDARNIAFAWDERKFQGWDAVIVVPSNSKQDAIKDYSPYFRSIVPAGDVDVPLGGQSALTLHLFKAQDYYRPYPMVYGLSKQSPIPR